MACVTMKRPVEVLGSPHAVENEPMSKRQRCGPSLFPTTPPSCNLTQDSDSFRGNFHYGSPVSINRGIKRAKRKLDVDDHYSSPSNSRNPLSPFLGATPQLQTGKLVAQLEQELKRLQRRKTLLGSATSLTGLPSPSSVNKEQPLFTLRQVTIVCQRMLKEREEQIKEEYDKVLVSKLSEQYDAFVKFSHDQVERRLTESTCSYVS